MSRMTLRMLDAELEFASAWDSGAASEGTSAKCWNKNALFSKHMEAEIS